MKQYCGLNACLFLTQPKDTDLLGLAELHLQLSDESYSIDPHDQCLRSSNKIETVRFSATIPGIASLIDGLVKVANDLHAFQECVKIKKSDQGDLKLEAAA